MNDMCLKTDVFGSPQALVKLVPYNQQSVKKSTLKEFNLREHEIKGGSHKVDHVETNKILQANSARTLRIRFQRKPQTSEKLVREKKLENMNKWAQFKERKQEAIDRYIQVRKQ